MWLNTTLLNRRSLKLFISEIHSNKRTHLSNKSKISSKISFNNLYKKPSFKIMHEIEINIKFSNNLSFDFLFLILQYQLYLNLMLSMWHFNKWDKWYNSITILFTILFVITFVRINSLEFNSHNLFLFKGKNMQVIKQLFLFIPNGSVNFIL